MIGIRSVFVIAHRGLSPVSIERVTIGSGLIIKAYGKVWLLRNSKMTGSDVASSKVSFLSKGSSNIPKTTRSDSLAYAEDDGKDW